MVGRRVGLMAEKVAGLKAEMKVGLMAVYLVEKMVDSRVGMRAG